MWMSRGGERVNIYLAQNDAPTPVYLFAHANGGSAYGFGQNSADLIVGAGYALVSWASLITIASDPLHEFWHKIHAEFAGGSTPSPEAKDGMVQRRE